MKTGEGQVYQENTSIKTYKIPVYYADQLKLFYQLKQSIDLSTTTYLITTSAYQNKTIAIYNTENNFAPKFELGDMIAFEKTENFKNGEIILVYIEKLDSILLKKSFRVSSDILLLDPINSPLMLKISDGDYIIGCYRECVKKAKFS